MIFKKNFKWICLLIFLVSFISFCVLSYNVWNDYIGSEQIIQIDLRSPNRELLDHSECEIHQGHNKWKIKSSKSFIIKKSQERLMVSCYKQKGTTKVESNLEWGLQKTRGFSYPYCIPVRSKVERVMGSGLDPNFRDYIKAYIFGCH